MFSLLLASLGEVLHLKYLLPLAVGTWAGLIGGAIPGVTITMTIILVLPFTFGLDPLQGLAAMTGVYVGGCAGGLVLAIALATTLATYYVFERYLSVLLPRGRLTGF